MSSLIRRMLPVILCTLVMLPAGAQENQETGAGDTSELSAPPARVQSWVLLDRAKRLCKQGDFGESLRAFREIESRGAYIPEVKFWQGYIYMSEGEYDLAQRYYNEALANRQDLYVPEDEFAIRYQLALLYKHRYMMDEYRHALLDILSFDRTFSESKAGDFYQAMEETLVERGIDKWIELYRLRETRVLEAHDSIARYYYSESLDSQALPHVMTSLLTRISIILDELFQLDPAYEFISLAHLLQDVQRWDHLVTYMHRTGFYESLYVFACVFYEVGSLPESSEDTERSLYLDCAHEAWTLITLNAGEESGVQSEWAKRGYTQLVHPFFDPTIR